MQAAMQQSGFPAKAWDSTPEYASTVFAITQPAAINSLGKMLAGNVLPEFAAKAEMTCWEARDNSEKFEGVI